MIPVRDRLDYLERCLRSVLEQAGAREHMQVEVVDNSRSGGEEIRDFVRRVAGDRVDYFRQPTELGMTANWNSCIQRARGQLVHVLHDDDWVEPGFYNNMAHAAQQHASAALIVARSFIVDDRGNLIGLSERALPYEREPSSDPRPILYENQFRTPAAVMRRNAVERCGGFRDFGHVSDWEMWIRLIACGGCVFINQPLASYRLSAGALTDLHERSGAAVRDAMRLGTALAQEVPQVNRGEFAKRMAVAAEDRLLLYWAKRDTAAMNAYARLWWEAARGIRRTRGAIRMVFRMTRRLAAAGDRSKT